MEVSLLNTAAPDNDLAMQGGPQPIVNAALHLRLQNARVDDHAAVGHAHDTVDPGHPVPD